MTEKSRKKELKPQTLATLEQFGILHLKDDPEAIEAYFRDYLTTLTDTLSKLNTAVKQAKATRH